MSPPTTEVSLVDFLLHTAITNGETNRETEADKTPNKPERNINVDFCKNSKLCLKGFIQKKF